MLRLRVDVFVVEQECPYPELDGRDLDATTRHIRAVTGGTRNGEPGNDGGDVGGADPAAAPGATVGCLRVLRDPDGTARIGRVCTAARVRGTGLGARLMRAALDVVGDTECVLDAQTYATGFYARFGFRVEGDEFDEDGIPHVTMRRPRT
ncbi:GNAT family N-acetyltransferase [Saccharomonospora iraqiensis]|uniref:GNAT family N-acetyltransferase n=1 Tax=Saccharomonospora iraqiensis TaxID=52698 RepID=UPI0012FBA807|nr:GNAT family N-acetyltransferase [Saccharomonospora iraqiensis]